MQPKRRPLLPLLFLLSFAALFLLFTFHSSSSPSSSSSSLLSSNPNPNPRFTFIIKVLTFDRIDSLRRCLRSLAAADYAGDTVHLHVLVDHFRPPANRSSDLPVDRKLEESRRILDLVDRLRWAHGEKIVHYRTANAGLQAQWLEAWWPSSDDEFAFVVEDDLQLSPLYYKFLKGLILKYYYDPANYDPSVYGASLQRPRFVAGKKGNKLRLGSETRIFLYQMVGTWGQLLFPKPWKEFRLWYDEHKTKGIKPFLQGMVTTGWYNRFGERIWTPWFIKFIHSRGYYNIYTNFKQERALSISYRDAGVNYGKTVGPDSSLLVDEYPDFNLWELPPLRDLKWYDFCFTEMLPGRVVSSFDGLRSILYTMEKQKTIIVISLYQTPERIARNLICYLEKVGLLNFILLGGNPEFLIDLARRGYPVIDTNQLISSIRHDKSMDLERETNIIKEIWVKATVVQKCLELGYDLWLVDGNTIPGTGLFLELSNPSYDFAVAKDVELLFVKSSPSSLKMWNDDYIRKVAAEGKSLTGSNSPMEHKNFVYLAMKALVEEGNVRLWRFDDIGIGVKLGATTMNHTRSSMVFWAQGMALASVQRELERLGMWLIDVDSSCVSVVCHKR